LLKKNKLKFGNLVSPSWKWWVQDLSRWDEKKNL
jgi:hypothetical protein